MKKVTLKRVIDSRNRVNVPREVLEECGLKAGDTIYFEITRNNNLLIRKEKNNDTN